MENVKHSFIFGAGRGFKSLIVYGLMVLNSISLLVIQQPLNLETLKP